jgi:uncharacterized membrane protein YfcA
VRGRDPGGNRAVDRRAGEPGRPPGSFGCIVRPAFAGIVVASTFAAPPGARLAQRLSDATRRRIFALFVAILGLRMLWGLLK